MENFYPFLGSILDRLNSIVQATEIDGISDKSRLELIQAYASEAVTITESLRLVCLDGGE